MAGKIAKSTLLVALMLAMSIWAPAAIAETKPGEKASGSGDNPLGEITDPDALRGIAGMLPMMMGGFGPSGQVLGQVLDVLLNQVTDIEGTESAIPGLFILNATASDTKSGNISLGNKDRPQIQYNWVPYDYYNSTKDDLNTTLNTDGKLRIEYPYCLVNRTGEGNLTVTRSTGMSVTIMIWDSDKSLINTIATIVDNFKAMQKAQADATTSGVKDPKNDPGVQAAVKNAISAVLYLLIHINDIITGDELILFNPISYETYAVNGTFGETHTWFVDAYNTSTGTRQTFNLTEKAPGVLGQWQSLANTKKDGYMQWLFSPAIPYGQHNATWGSFSFDLIQLWLKRFYVSIDVGELMSAFGGSSGSTQQPNPAKILKNMTIEFYLLWHHLMAGVFYNDADANGKIDVTYVNATRWNPATGKQEPFQVDGKWVERPNSTEVSHIIGVRKLVPSQVQWREPVVSGGSVSWGVRFDDIMIHWIPVGMDAEKWARDNPEKNATLDFMDLGFTFTPGTEIPLTDVDGNVIEGKTGKDCSVKLDQAFGEWNAKPADIDSSLDGADFATIYVSSILHVKFTGAMLDKAQKGDTTAFNEAQKPTVTRHSTEKKNLVFGRAAGDEVSAGTTAMLGRVDIAGIDYDIWEYGGKNDAAKKHTEKASTQTIPLGLFTYDAKAGMDYSDAKMQGGGFTASAALGIEFQVMMYSVNYPAFSDYSGGQIIHDPTFSIFMTFESGTAWAVFLLIGVVALVGVAAILITRSKNNR